MNIYLQLVGTSQCRRYQKMRALVLDVAAQLEAQIQLEEINDTERLSQSNPLDLPQLYINGALVASRNPPKAQVIKQQIQQASRKNHN